MPISIGHYLNNLSKLTNQWTAANYNEHDRQRIYLKDIDCPPIWHEKLKEQIPPSVFYLNECTGEFGGPGAFTNQQQGAARAGDLMSCLPPAMRADNMMCYIGHEGTYTPAHREMCASLGQNLMVETSDTRDEDGKPGKPGSSIWFMTETKDRHLVSEYWLSTLRHDIEVESHFAQINAWKAAPFKTYIVDQRAGDFILIPPLAPHQVWNRGTRTMKAAWNRTTVETLEMAIHEALPRARMVCRDEQYKNKAIVYFALEKYSDQLKQVQSQASSTNAEGRYRLSHSLKIRQLQKDFKRLYALYTEILLSETLAPVSTAEKRGQYLPYDSFVTCSYCRCNIFNRFLTCPTCVAPLENGEEDTYDICMDCYAMGRSCSCLSKYKWVEQFPWQELINKHEVWRNLIIDFEGGVNEKSPPSLETARKNMDKKTLAQVCQEQLKARPFHDPKKPRPVRNAFTRRHPGSTITEKEDQEVQVDDEGQVKKSTSKKTRAEKLPKGWVMEHVSNYSEEKWKVAHCTSCQNSYSYGSLFRMFDLMPQTVMEDPNWKCPACLKICSCGACRKKTDMKPHEPTGTVLGHDTKKVADPRSVESLVNFSLSNLGWIKRTGDDHPHESRRLSRRRDAAERAKAKDPTLDDNYVDDEEHSPPAPSEQDVVTDNGYATDTNMAIDPMLLGDQPSVPSNGRARGPNDGSSRAGIPQRQNKRGGSLDQTNGIEHTTAPIANMVSLGDQVQGFTSNGIAYEYPDPTEPQTTTSYQIPNYHQPDNDSHTGQLASSNTHSSIGNLSQALSNGQGLSQLETMLENAKLTDRYFSTEAAFTGKSLRITLSLSSDSLNAVLSRPPIPKASRSAANGSRAGPPIILQSDFPSVVQVEQPSMAKKRKAKPENDDDFTARKRRDRKSATVQVSAKDTRRKSAKYTEPSSDSEVEMQDEAQGFVPINKPRGPRPLPRYIAQRTEEDSNSPPNDVRNKNPPPTQDQSSSLRNDTTREKENQLTDTPISNPSMQAVTSARTKIADSIQRKTATIYAERTGRKDDSAQKIQRDVQQVPVNGEDSALRQKPTPQNEKVKARVTPVDPARKSAEDNRLAKMKALQWADDVEDSSSHSDSSSIGKTPVKSAVSSRKLIPTPKSIFSRPGMKGRKIKIVAAKT